MFMTILLALLAALLGLLLCFAGYRLFLVLLPIWGFFAGLWLGAGGFSLLFGEGFLSTVTGLVAGFVLGIIFALLSYLFYGLAIALVAAVLGGSLGFAVMLAFGMSPSWVVYLIALACAALVVFIVLAFNVQKYVVITLTALAGADLVIIAVLLLLGFVAPADLQGGFNPVTLVFEHSFLGTFIWMILAGVGLVYQVFSNRKYVFKKEHYTEAWG
jgi:hypothetical protein